MKRNRPERAEQRPATEPGHAILTLPNEPASIDGGAMPGRRAGGGEGSETEPRAETTLSPSDARDPAEVEGASATNTAAGSDRSGSAGVDPAVEERDAPGREAGRSDREAVRAEAGLGAQPHPSERQDPESAAAWPGLSPASLRFLLLYVLFGLVWFALAGPVARALSPGTGGGGLLRTAGWTFVLASLPVLLLLYRDARLRAGRGGQRLAAVLAASVDPVAVLRRRDGRVLEVSPAFGERLGYGPGEAVGRSLTDLGLWSPEDADRFTERLSAHGSVRGLEAELRARDGTPRSVVISAQPVFGAGGELLWLARDVTEERRFQALDRHHALYDPLTDLPNRSLLLDRLGQALVRAGRRGTKVGVAVLNLDRFRIVNESLGHDAGDRLLVEVAERIRKTLRREDTVARPLETISRLGADEFTIVVEGLARVADVQSVVRRVVEALAGPYRIQERDVAVSVCVGIAVSDDLEVTPEELLRRAAIALRRAKEKGLGRQHLFDLSVDSRAIRRIRLEGDLRAALEREELELHFQPIVSLDDGRIVGLESLVRWKHPELGFLSPLEVVPIAEESGLIHSLGRQVLREACRRGRAWHDRFVSDPPLVLAVNVSAREIQEPRFQETVAAILEETGFPPASLELEITEGLMMQSLMGLHRLKSLGIRIAIDDFGTGYSSLAYLSRLPADTIKIDRSFVEELGRDADTTAVARAMVAMAQSLELDTIAEGIETEQQLDQVRSLGCTYAQGYLFSRPLRPADAEALLERDPRW